LHHQIYQNPEAKTEAMKAPAINFPKTPEHPTSINAELQYRLDFLRVLDRTRRLAVKAQQHLSATSAWTRADQWLYELLVKAARDSIDELGPLSSAAQKTRLADFVQSLETMALHDASTLMAIGLTDDV
jgi:hypothetical protein